MAADGVNNLQLVILHGQKKIPVNVTLPPNEPGEILSVKHLAATVTEITEVPVRNQKLIYKGKSLSNENQVLKDLGIVAGSKVMLIGKKLSSENNEYLKAIAVVEKKIEEVVKRHGEITCQSDAIHKGHLPVDLRYPAFEKLSKQMCVQQEVCMKLLESLDAIHLPEDQAIAKTKRKTSVVKIQKVLGEIDSLVKGINEMLTKGKRNP